MRTGLWTIAASLLVLASTARAEESAWTLFEKGLKEFQKKHYDRAENIFTAATRMDARCEDAWYYLGKISERRGKSREAAEHYQKVTEKAGTYPLAAERLGHLALKSGDKEAAAKCFRIYADARPSTNAYLQLANVELGAKKYKEAEQTLAKARKFGRGDLDVTDMYGRLYMETERYGEALDAYGKILAQIPRDTNARYLRGVCLRQLEREDEAYREWETVLDADPYHGLALKGLVKAYEGDPAKRTQVKEYRLRLKRLMKSKPPTRPVKGGN